MGTDLENGMAFQSFGAMAFMQTNYYHSLPEAEKASFDLLSLFFHFKANNFVLSNLIDWENVPNDPIYRLVFPRKEMLPIADYNFLSQMRQLGLGRSELIPFVEQIKEKLFPGYSIKLDPVQEHEDPLDQMKRYHTFPSLLSLHPSPMVKTCHAYCSYCFRWLNFQNRNAQENTSYSNPDTPLIYLDAHPEIKEVLFTGADPLVLPVQTLIKYIEPILDVSTVEVISISTKSISWWPYRFTTDKDAEELLRFFSHVQKRGKHLNLIGHFTHPVELKSEPVRQAIEKIKSVGVVIRTQGPLIKGINDEPEIWSEMWTQQVKLGLVPYYFLVEFDQNATDFFQIPLEQILDIYQTARNNCNRVARTVTGPMFLGRQNRIILEGTIELSGQKYFVFKERDGALDKGRESALMLLDFDEEIKGPNEVFRILFDSVS